MNSTLRLFIADPSLKDARGHHYGLTKSISAAAHRRGINPIWLASKDVSDALDERAEVVPTFELTMYAAYMRTDPPKPLSLLARTRERIGHLWARLLGRQRGDKEPAHSLDLSGQILRDLKHAIAQFEIGIGDQILFHTADGATFEALASLIAQFKAQELPTIHVCTPYDPEGVMPNRKDAEQIVTCIDAFRRFGVLGKSLHLYAENSLLADHLSEIWSVDVQTLALPASPISTEMALTARRFREESMKIPASDFVAVSLGAARLEKGFDTLPDIIQHAYEIAESGTVAPIDPQALKFVLHASPQIIGRHPEILLAIERLNDFPKEQVKLLLEPLSDEEYRNLTLASDCVIMPYDPNAYRVRGSGIVSEAIVAKKPILAKSGSYPAFMALSQGGAIGETAYEMALALVRLMYERDARMGRIEASASAYLVENSADKYIDMIWRTHPDSSVPSDS